LWIAHAVEAVYAEGANPLTSLMAEEGIAALPRELPRIVAAPARDNVSLIVVGGMPETSKSSVTSRPGY